MLMDSRRQMDKLVYFVIETNEILIMTRYYRDKKSLLFPYYSTASL